MKKLFVTICALALVVPAVNAADLKIGYVTVDKVLADAPQVKAINDAMLERFGGKKKSSNQWKVSSKPCRKITNAMSW